MSEDAITIMNEKFNKSDGTQVDGLTLMVEGIMKTAFDRIKEDNNYETYDEVFRDVLLEGVNAMILKGKQSE